MTQTLVTPDQCGRYEKALSLSRCITGVLFITVVDMKKTLSLSRCITGVLFISVVDMKETLVRLRDAQHDVLDRYERECLCMRVVTNESGHE